IFALTDQILLRLLPVENPRALVQLRVNGGRFGSQSGDGIHTFPYPTYVALRDNNTVFTGLTGQRIEGASLIAGDRNEIVSLGLVAGNYFDVMGVRPHLGRTITPDDDRQLNGHPVVVLQYDFWRTRFDARSDLIGQPIRLNGLPFTVIGVAARGYEGTDTGLPTKAWVPVAMRPTISPSDPRLDDERSSWFYLFARVKPGVTLDQAQASMRVVYRQRQNEELNNDLFTRFPVLKERFLRQTFLLEPAEKGASGLRSILERPLIVLHWLVGAVLLIACSNVAGLLLARGEARQREMAIRCAIGAGRGRMIRQLLSESLLLAAGGGAAGLLIGWTLIRFLISMLPVDPSSLSLSATPDPRILLFTLAVTALTTLVFGLLPAWQMSGVEPAATMRAESGSIAGGHVRLRKVFVALQVGLSVMLLLGAGLFVRTLRNLQAVDLGLHTESACIRKMWSLSPCVQPRPSKKAAGRTSTGRSSKVWRGLRACARRERTPRAFSRAAAPMARLPCPACLRKTNRPVSSTLLLPVTSKRWAFR
ncbi:MAG: FtsX-like permease family protein, partial [Bryobacterales bacterium]|nr:FtsX-like permease family protein [Bryobacterales bacterium]